MLQDFKCYSVNDTISKIPEKAVLTISHSTTLLFDDEGNSSFFFFQNYYQKINYIRMLMDQKNYFLA